jgi:succinyl-diaminopimelate desuccinylase
MSLEVDRGQPALAQRILQTQAHLDPQALLDTLVALVRVPSVFDPSHPGGNERAAADLVAALLDQWGMRYRRWDIAPERPNLVVDLPGTRPGPILIFEGHTDVVTVGDPRAWTVPPFAAHMRDGRLYGRGACDMKGGVVAMLFAARALQMAGCDYAGTLRLAILADEEGMMQGAKSFVAEGYLAGATAAVICEPEGDRVCVAQKGAIRLRVTLNGKMAHGCMPEEGINPVAALGEVIVACRALEREIQQERPPHQLLGQFSLTPTVVLGGEREQGNVIPSRAELIFDIRTTTAHDHDEIRRRTAACIASAVGRVSGATYRVEVMDDRPATETDPNDPIVLAAIVSHEVEAGVTPAFGGVPGSTDGTIFWSATRIPLVTWGPGSTTLPHQADEWVAVDEVVRYARSYVGVALRYFDLMERG